MSFTIHPFCENDWDAAISVPRNCVHAGPVSLGLLPKDYKADSPYLWRAGINPSTNLLVASTSYERGLVGSAATSTPRYWWISGPINDQATLEAKVKEVVGRLPERAVNNYVPFSDYSIAYEWAKTNGYALINCNYPAYRLGDYDSTTASLINIETGFLPSFDGATQKIRNLANPTPSQGFGDANPKAMANDSISIQGAGGGFPSSIGSEAGIIFAGSGHISQTTNPIQDGITNGIIFEGIMMVPDGTANPYVLLQARDAADSTLIRLDWVNGGGAGTGWRILYGATVAYAELTPSSPLLPGRYYFCVSIPKSQNGAPVNLYVSGANGISNPIVLTDQSTSATWNVGNVRFTFGSMYDGSSGQRQVSRFYSAKVHNIVGAWDTNFHDSFYTTNWPIAQSLYGL